MTDYNIIEYNENVITGDNFIIIPYTNNDEKTFSLVDNISEFYHSINDELTFKIITTYFMFYVLFSSYLYIINYDYNFLNWREMIPFFNKEKNVSKVDYSKIDKYDIENAFDSYIEIIKINQFLREEDTKNLNKVIDFYRYSTQISTKLKNIINDKYRYIFVNADKFYEYYGRNNNLIEILDCEDEELVCINLQKLYCEEQLLVGKELFDINNKEKYVSLRKGDLCFMTNYSKLNVIIWLIQTGIYDYIEKHYI